MITETLRQVRQKKLEGVEPRRNLFVVAVAVFKHAMSALLVKRWNKKT